MIKVVKRVIFVILGLVDVNDEELMIVFIGVEVLINLRLLIYQFVNLSDDVFFMLNYFFYGQIGGQFVLESVDDDKNLNIKKRW